MFSVMKSPTKCSSTKTLINVVIHVSIKGGGGEGGGRLANVPECKVRCSTLNPKNGSIHKNRK